MSNAAIYLHPNGFDTTGTRLLGRHSAGESFLRGFLRHGDVERFYFWNVMGHPQERLQALVDRIHPPTRPVTWISPGARSGLGLPGVVNLPGPDLPREAWARRLPGARAYGICGVTHTTATDNVMRILADTLIAPVEAYDALICTSTAVRAAVEAQLESVRDYLALEFGPRRRPEPIRATIPLGVNIDDFSVSAEARADWRARLDIPDAAVVALYVGRFNTREKMNPALMALSLERAAQTASRPICWVMAGWLEANADAQAFHDNIQALCPSVLYRVVDGRPPENRFSIWSVGDFFVSLSDNVQETFGLTPVEAMAAGLPCVVTDWDGYKDTVRHGEDGFRITTYAPPPGDGADLAYAYATARMTYTNYVGAAAQCVAIDHAQAAEAIVALVDNPELRRTLGEQARRRVREVFDWAAVIPQYQALWAEQNARRLALEPAPRDPVNPFRPDPFRLFASYPTHHVTSAWRVATAPGASWESAWPVLSNPLSQEARYNQMTGVEVQATLEWLAGRGVEPIAEVLAQHPTARHGPVLRGLQWLARFGVIVLIPPE